MKSDFKQHDIDELSTGVPDEKEKLFNDLNLPKISPFMDNLFMDQQESDLELKSIN